MTSIIKLVICVAALCHALPALAAPKLVVENSDFDFGQIYQGENVAHDFIFFNEGDQPLLIEKVRSSCGCTAALVSSREIQPGESGEIKANFDSTRFRGDVSKTVYLYTNDTSQPVVQMYIKGFVKEMLILNPKQLSFVDLVPKETVIKQVDLKNQGQKTLTVLSSGTTAKELQVQLAADEIKAGQTLPVTVQYTPKPGQSRFSGYVLINIEGGAQNELRIPVYATIQK
ncbi:MAG: DUF1573 domain-containing protein [Deltaproteobacteria bacterium]|jgi:hypothetical protein|nr:DUF1573 domain-containing protein [Deltaproteobacteria bacterium]MBW2476722.1 DUF1573 domain-containing protein [Deltaproteobacteria bacterium]MBW2518993.1 DUF1573 domain-containing protein [Deltaproteobacteria bacterium]